MTLMTVLWDITSSSLGRSLTCNYLSLPQKLDMARAIQPILWMTQRKYDSYDTHMLLLPI